MMNPNNPNGHTDAQIDAALSDALRSYGAPIKDEGFSLGVMNAIISQARATQTSADNAVADLSVFATEKKHDPKRTGLLFLAGFIGAGVAATQLPAMGRLLLKSNAPDSNTLGQSSVLEGLRGLPGMGANVVKNMIGQAPSMPPSLDLRNTSLDGVMASGPSAAVLPIMAGFIILICLWAVQSSLSNS